MVRDIGQILVLLQQQTQLKGAGDTSSLAAEPSTSQQQLQQHNLDTDRQKSGLTEARSSCSLPTVAESKTEFTRQGSQGLSTQRSFDSATRYLSYFFFILRLLSNLSSWNRQKDLEVRITAVDRGKPHSELLSGIQRMPDRSPTIRPLRLSVKFILMLLGQAKKRTYN